MSVYLQLPDFSIVDIELTPEDTSDAVCRRYGFPGAVLELFGRELDPQAAVGVQDVYAGDMLIMRRKEHRSYVFHCRERRICVQASDFEGAMNQLANELYISASRVLLTDMNNVALSGIPQSSEFRVFEKPVTDIYIDFPYLGTQKSFRASATLAEVRQALALGSSYELACRGKILLDDQMLSSVMPEKGTLEIVWENGSAVPPVVTEITHF